MADRQSEREIVYCHECENEWHRDEHGLICPRCQSDFTEIIEADHDPRDDHLEEESDSPGPNPFMLHNPWSEEAPDPDEDDIDEVTYRNIPGGMAFTRTIYRSSSPRAGPRVGGPRGGDPMIDNFQTLLQSIMGPQGTTSISPGDSPRPGYPRDRSRSPPDQTQDPGAGPQPFSGRITFNTTGRLYPRDANNPQPQVQPVDNIHSVLGLLFSHLNEMHPPSDPNDNNPNMPPNPFAALMTSILNPAAAAHGDAVYTQEALDRVISQLMEQNASGNAPGPASPQAIAALPKQKITPDMLDASTGKADCSICMDEVAVGEEVTVLPCHHWFHEACIGAWLGEHDTCPQCRQGIMPKDGAADAPRSSGQEPMNTQRMDSGGAGSMENPLFVGSSPPRQQPPPGAWPAGGGGANTGSGSGTAAENTAAGLGSRVRGWFGSSSGNGSSGSGSGTGTGNVSGSGPGPHSSS